MTTLTPEQEQVLAELFAPAHSPLSVCPGNPAASPAPAAVDQSRPASTDALGAWLGFSAADLRQHVHTWLARKDGIEQEALAWLERNPLDAAFEFLATASLAFYLAEKEVNPRVKSYIDAFYYIATCASVGYADIFAATQPGRAVASLVMILGPSITARATDRPASGRPPVTALAGPS